MATAILAVFFGLALMVWSADRFIDGSAAAARYFGMSPLLIGMVIVGFGTSAPEMVVSALAASEGNPGIALGNAFGSNITNIALILGLTSLITPIAVHSRVLRKELPILTLVTALVVWQTWDGEISRAEALLLLGIFALFMGWTIWQGLREPDDRLSSEYEQALQTHSMSIGRAFIWILAGLVLLVGSSQLLVWGAVEIARDLGVSNLFIGLTIVALGTSLPELASSIMASRKGEPDIAIGNVLGSNLFNSLAVVGIAGVIQPMQVSPEVIVRDLPVMTALTLSLFLFGYGFGGQGSINRLDGSVLLGSYLSYTAYLLYSVMGRELGF